MDDIMAMHEVACFEHLPNDLLSFERFYARVIAATLQFVENRAIQLFKDQEDSIVLSKNFE